MDQISLSQYTLVYNAFSFTIAVMGASTIFFFLRSFQVSAAYRTAVTVTGLVTLIACYHYFRIFSSWEAAFDVVGGVVKPTGVAFNDAYRYVDWLLTVPLLLVESFSSCVCRLPKRRPGPRSLAYWPPLWWFLGIQERFPVTPGHAGFGGHSQ